MGKTIRQHSSKRITVCPNPFGISFLNQAKERSKTMTTRTSKKGGDLLWEGKSVHRRRQVWGAKKLVSQRSLLSFELDDDSSSSLSLAPSPQKSTQTQSKSRTTVVADETPKRGKKDLLWQGKSVHRRREVPVKKLTSQQSSSSFDLDDSSSSLSPSWPFQDSPPKKHQALNNTAAPDRPRKGKSRIREGSGHIPLSLSQHCRNDRQSDPTDDDDFSSPGRTSAVPRSEDFSRALSKLVADEATSQQQLRQQREDSLEALKQLWNWARSVRDVEEIETIVADFVDYGGVLKILDFLRRKDCTTDSKCVAGATWVLVEFLSLADGISENTSPPTSRRHRRSSSYTRSYVEMSKTIVRRDGIQALIVAVLSLKFEEGSSLAIANIWRALGRIINKKSLKLLDASEQLSIIDAAKYCLQNIERLERKLGDGNDENDSENDNNMAHYSSDRKKEQNNDWLDDILRPLLYTLGNAMNETSALTKADFRRTKVVPMCVRTVLQRQEQLSDSKEGVDCINEVVLENLLFILRFASMNDMLNSPGDCAELVLPLCIYAITNGSRSSSSGDSESTNKGRSKKKIELDGLKLLEETCSKVDEVALENSGALEAVTSLIMNASGDIGDHAGDDIIADGGDNDETTIKQKAHAVMRKMLKRTSHNVHDSVID